WISAGGSSCGTFDAAAGARVLFIGDSLRHRTFKSECSTDVCSSDLITLSNDVTATVSTFVHSGGILTGPGLLTTSGMFNWTAGRSEERRVGKECSSRWLP